MTPEQNAIDKTSFPYGVRPDVAVDDSTEDGRGADTVNRLLLHGARYHERESVFVRWEQGRKGWGWNGHPDWRADRNAIRVALVLRQRVGMDAGDRVALWIPLGMRWAETERGVWSIGGLTVPVWPEWNVDRVSELLHESSPTVLFAPDADAFRELKAVGGLPDSVKATVLLAGETEDLGDEALSHAEFMDYGGILDTAERSSAWRTMVRGIEPDLEIALEYRWDGELRPSGSITQGGLAGAVEAVLRRLPPEEGRLQILAGERPDPVSRALLYAAWADGLTRTAFVRSRAGIDHAAELRPSLLAGPEEIVVALATEVGEPGDGARALSVCITDGPTAAEEHTVAYKGTVSFFHANQIDVPLNEFPGDTS